MSDADLARLFECVAAERHVAGSRLLGVTSPTARAGDAAALRRPARPLDRVRRNAPARRSRSRGEARRPRRRSLSRITTRSTESPPRTATGAALGVRVVRRGRAERGRGRCGDAHSRSAPLRHATRSTRELIALRDMRRGRAERIVVRLNELGVRIEMAAVLEQAAGGAIGRPHVARAMIAEGWAVDFRDAFDRYLGSGRPAYVAKERLTAVDAIGAIHRAGGLAVLAHPAQSGTRERIEAFVRAGHRRSRSPSSEPFARGRRATHRARRISSDWCRAAGPTGTARRKARARSA